MQDDKRDKTTAVSGDGINIDIEGKLSIAVLVYSTYKLKHIIVSYMLCTSRNYFQSAQKPTDMVIPRET